MSKLSNNTVQPAARPEAAPAPLAPAPATFMVPAGFKLVPDEEGQDAKSLREQKEFRAWVEKGPTRITQEAADALFTDGRTRYRVVLKDGNCHPEIEVNAWSDVDAVHRYNRACGINGWDHNKYKHAVAAVGAGPGENQGQPVAKV